MIRYGLELARLLELFVVWYIVGLSIRKGLAVCMHIQIGFQARRSSFLAETGRKEVCMIEPNTSCYDVL